ncbi:NAD(P)/FAD-dependent oxidoreductase [Marivita sp. S0852]|uniref:NAD(P)/FAD-dependent oxidoreductase n=1 Tax=Marivita sp. S0852 TaxID=3373893 RepID=UPI00398226B4
MRRIYETSAYQTPQSCWWWSTTSPQALRPLQGPQRTEVAIIGGGFTGMNAALALAKAGVQTCVLDAQHPGWGASGRNGGFCCLGGAKATDASLTKRFGTDQCAQWHQAERAAVDHVAGLLADYKIDADTHSDGETLLAHSPRAMAQIRATAKGLGQAYQTDLHVFGQDALRQLGLNGRFHGGMTLPVGFALNPAKYHAGVLAAAQTKGVIVYEQTPATAITRDGAKWRVSTPSGTVHADKVILATNGYSSEDLPDWLRARYLPVQSSIIVTRPLSEQDQARQGWTSLQMCYDTRILLHYFRLMPDGRFLFGMRGGLRATPRSETALASKIRAHFHHMFPAWRDVKITHHWSGLLCLMRSLTPFCGAVPDHPGLYAAMGYHGNGVAMGSYLGACVADHVLGRVPQGPFPAFLRQPPKRFPLGSLRRALLAPAYAAAAVKDR